MGRKKKITGIGDAIAAITSAAGIAPCESCNKRKDLLNVSFPFQKAKVMSNEQKLWFGDYLQKKSNILTYEDRKKINELYNDCFQTDVKLCGSCSGLYVAIIKKLTKLYEL
jgi:hypothetical protein